MIYSNLLEWSKSTVKALQLHNLKDIWFRKTISYSKFTKVWLQELSFYLLLPFSSLYSLFIASEIKP